MQGSHRPLSSSPSPLLLGRLSALLGALALAGFGFVSLEIAQAGDPPPPDPDTLAIPISGTNIYSIPEEHEVEIWTGHLGGDCQPKRLTTAQLFDPRCAIQTSDDGSTLAYLTSSGVAFERRDGFRMSRANLQGSYHPGVAGAAELVLSGSGGRAAYVTREGASDLLRTTLWTVDLGAGDPLGALPAKAVKPKRVKRSAPGVHVLPVGWSPSGESLIYLEQTPLRGGFVSLLVVRDVPAQTENEIYRSLGRVDFALPFPTAAGTGNYRVLVGLTDQVRWVSPTGDPDQVLLCPHGTPLVGEGIRGIVSSRKHPQDLAILMSWAVRQVDGRVQGGVYRFRGSQALQLTSKRDSTSISYGPDGTLSLASSDTLRFFSEDTDASFGFEDSDGNPLTIRATDWHASQPMLAIAVDDGVLVLDLSGTLADDEKRRCDWSQFVGLRAPGRTKPTLHSAFRLKAGSPKRIAGVLWHGDRLVWTLEESSQGGLPR